MDPRLFKLLGIKLQAPADDLGGGGADHHGEDNGDDGDNGDDDDDEGDDDDDDEGDDDEGEGDDGDDDGDEDLGDGANKRIRQLNEAKKAAEGQVADLTRQLEEARKLGGDDGKAILAAAEASGILPGLLSKDEADAFSSMDQYSRVIDAYDSWLDEHEESDVFETGDGKTMSYAKVQRRVNQLRGDLDDLKSEYGDRRKELKGKVRKIFELGLEAYRKGAETGKGKNVEKGQRKKLHDRPSGKKPKADGKKMNYGTVKSGKDMLALIMAQNKKD